jgi:hypothetical protein
LGQPFLLTTFFPFYLFLFLIVDGCALSAPHTEGKNKYSVECKEDERRIEREREREREWVAALVDVCQIEGEKYT